MNITKKSLDEKQKETLFLIKENFKKIITTNYDNIFLPYERKYIQFKKISSLKELGSNIYPIHGFIFNYNEQGILIENALPIIDTYKSFIENWLNTELGKTFEFLLTDIFENNNSILFIGYSFEDQFICNLIASFILKKNNDQAKNFNNDMFYVLINDFKYNEKEKQLEKNELLMEPLNRNIFGVQYIKFSEIMNNLLSDKQYKLILNELINKISNAIKRIDIFKKMYNVKNQQYFKESFDLYFFKKDEKWNFNDYKFLIFISDFIIKNYDLLLKEGFDLNQKLDKIFNYISDNINDNIKINNEVQNFIINNSDFFDKFLFWIETQKKVNDLENPIGRFFTND